MLKHSSHAAQLASSLLVCLTCLFVTAFPGGAGAQSTPTWITSARQDNIAYFLFDSRIERYDFIQAKWLPRITLPRSGATSLCATASHLFVAYGQSCFRYTVSGTTETFVRNVNDPIHSLLADGNLLFINSSSSSYARFQSIKISTNSYVASHEAYIDSSYGSVIFPHSNKICGVNRGMSPADVVQTSYNEDGTFVATADSPYHGDYEIGNKTFAFASGAKFADTTGNVYSVNGMVNLQNFNGKVDDLDFYGNAPIILRDSDVRGFSPSLMQSGIKPVTAGTSKIWVYGEKVFGFRPNASAPTGADVQALAVSTLNLQTGPISPVGLSFVPDRILIDKFGMAIVLSKAHQSVFFWNPATQDWSAEAIPTQDVATHIAYSPDLHTLYLSYATGAITKVDLSAATKVETHFTTLAKPATGLAAAGVFLLAAAPSSSSSDSHIVFSSAGAQVGINTSSYPSLSYEWSPTTRRMFFLRDGISPNDLMYQVIAANGAISGSGETPYHSSSGILHPIRVSETGSHVILGSGRVYDAAGNLTQVGSLGNGFIDAAWFGQSILTLRTSGAETSMQRWSSSNYGETAVTALEGTPWATRRIDATRYLVCTMVSGRPRFRVYDQDHAFVTPPNPPPPAGLLGAVVAGQIKLLWLDLDLEDQFVVQRTSGDSENWTNLVSLPANTMLHTDSTAVVGVPYRYRILARYSGNVFSNPSSELALHMQYPPPPATSAATIQSGGAMVTWSAIPSVINYVVERRVLPNGSFEVVSTLGPYALAYFDSAVTGGTSYEYRISSVTEVGQSTTASPTVQVELPPLPPLHFTAIYKISASASGTATGSLVQTGTPKLITQPIRFIETSYIAVDLTSTEAVQVTYWTETVGKVKLKRYSAADFSATYLVAPIGATKWQFSMLEASSGEDLPLHDGLWGHIRQVTGTASPYTLRPAGIAYTALPTSLAGKERFTFLGTLGSNTAADLRGLKTYDRTISVTLDAALTNSTMSGLPLPVTSGGTAEKRTLDHAVQTIINSLIKGGYSLAPN